MKTQQEREQKRQTDALDDRDTAWDHFLRELDDVILDNHYRWARDTLIGIRATVERTGRVSPQQREAVQHIIDGLWPFPRR